MASLCVSVAQYSPCLSGITGMRNGSFNNSSSSILPSVAMVPLRPRARHLCGAARADAQDPDSRSGNNPVSAVSNRVPQAAKSLGSALKDSVQGTKQEVNADTIKRNMEENVSEQKSVIGIEPAPGSPYPRPEIERRPETGERSFTNFMAVDGAGPETINGRLAMVGFVWAVLAEMRSHVPALYQLFDPSGFEQGQGRLWFIAVTLVIFGASLIPMFNGESTDSRKFGAFTAKAERWNGRLAMVGFAGLLLVESALGRAVF